MEKGYQMEAPEGCPQIIYNLMKDVSIIEIYRNVSRDDQQSYYIKFYYVYYYNFSTALRLSTIDVKCESQF